MGSERHEALQGAGGRYWQGVFPRWGPARQGGLVRLEAGVEVERCQSWAWFELNLTGVSIGFTGLFASGVRGCVQRCVQRCVQGLNDARP